MQQSRFAKPHQQWCGFLVSIDIYTTLSYNSNIYDTIPKQPFTTALTIEKNAARLFREALRISLYWVAAISSDGKQTSYVASLRGIHPVDP